MEAINILIIDDDDMRPILMKDSLEEYIESLGSKSSDFHRFFKGYNIKRLELEAELPKMTASVLANQPDCILIDYRLSSKKLVSYDGVELAESILENLRDIPLFILTAYEDDLFRNSSFNAYQVYDVEGLYDNAKTNNQASECHLQQSELQKKIIKQSIIYRQSISSLIEELKSLLAKDRSQRTAAEDSRILEIDSILEHSLDSKHSLPSIIREDIMSDNFEELINKVDTFLEMCANA